MTQQMRIGTFLAVTLLIVAAFIFIVGDMSRFFRKPGYSIYASFKSVAGLDKAATVRMSGVKIGTVKNIRLEGRHPRVELNLDPAAQVPVGSKATLSSLGLLGEKYVEIMPSDDASFIKAGETMDSLAAVSFDQLGLLIMSIGDEVKNVSGKLQKFVGEDNQTRFNELLTSLSETTQGLNDFLRANRDELDLGIRSASQTIRDFDRTVKDLAGSLESSAQSLKGLVDENREGVKAGLQKARDLLDRMQEAVSKLNGLLDKVDKGQGTLGRIIQDPELFDKARETIGNVDDIVRPLSKLEAGLDARAEYYPTSKLVKGGLTFNLRLSNGPFVQAQIIRDPWRERFTYSLQGGRRFGDFAPRVGIIESDFGLGLDYFAFRDRLQLSLDGYDFNRSPRPRFRLSSRFFPAKHVFLVLGLDDLAWNDQRQIFFGLGVGLR
jgi:phospholipid/cholesterol/gamma-HCH transport system substrate-binding protein